LNDTLCNRNINDNKIHLSNYMVNKMTNLLPNARCDSNSKVHQSDMKFIDHFYNIFEYDSDMWSNCGNAMYHHPLYRLNQYHMSISVSQCVIDNYITCTFCGIDTVLHFIIRVVIYLISMGHKNIGTSEITSSYLISESTRSTLRSYLLALYNIKYQLDMYISKLYERCTGTSTTLYSLSNMMFMKYSSSNVSGFYGYTKSLDELYLKSMSEYLLTNEMKLYEYLISYDDNNNGTTSNVNEIENYRRILNTLNMKLWIVFIDMESVHGNPTSAKKICDKSLLAMSTMISSIYSNNDLLNVIKVRFVNELSPYVNIMLSIPQSLELYTTAIRLVLSDICKYMRASMDMPYPIYCATHADVNKLVLSNGIRWNGVLLCNVMNTMLYILLQCTHQSNTYNNKCIYFNLKNINKLTSDNIYKNSNSSNNVNNGNLISNITEINQMTTILSTIVKVSIYLYILLLVVVYYWYF
jgi:hypothetical protein